jgi:DNA processing protein
LLNKRSDLLKITQDQIQILDLFSLLNALTNKTDVFEFARQHLPSVYIYLQNQSKDFDLLLQQHCKLLQQDSIHVLPWGSISYPKVFYHLKDPPAVIYVYGHLEALSKEAISVVGSRKMTLQTQQWMEIEFKKFLLATQICTVSGGAYGVDQSVHLLSVRLGLPTVVVLPCGLKQLYPSNLKAMQSEVLKTGGVFISEFSPEQRMKKYYFYHRNRLIAALGLALLVPQAQLRSGTLLTVQHAVDISRPVFAVPGHPQDLFFAGNLQIILEGATMARDAQDLNCLFSLERKVWALM